MSFSSRALTWSCLSNVPSSIHSSSDTSPLDQMRREHGQSEKEHWHHKQLVSSILISKKVSSVVKSCLSLTYTNLDLVSPSTLSCSKDLYFEYLLIIYVILLTESEVKANGKYQQKGKTYEVQDGDVIFWKFN